MFESTAARPIFGMRLMPTLLRSIAA
jgi:hypothetical protein